MLGVNEDITSFIHINSNALRSIYFVTQTDLSIIYDKLRFNSILPAGFQLETKQFSFEALNQLSTSKKYLLKGLQGNSFRNVTGEKAIPLESFSNHKLHKLLNMMPSAKILIQEIVQSDRPVLSVCCFSVKGKLITSFHYEKLRQHPKHFGTGTYLKSVFNADLLKATTQLIASLNYTGISEIEFIHDSLSNRYKIIEMNPRAWKSIHFATLCGRNLVSIFLSWLAGMEMNFDESYRCGAYWSDLVTDIPQSIYERKVLQLHKGFHDCIWNKDDPLPALALCILFPFIALKI